MRNLGRAQLDDFSILLCLGLSWETSWGLKSADLAPELNGEGWAPWGTAGAAPAHGLRMA